MPKLYNGNAQPLYIYADKKKDEAGAAALN